ncbi:hypothetical protein GCM10027513_08140 [Giesbergeria giesbergeri]
MTMKPISAIVLAQQRGADSSVPKESAQAAGVQEQARAAVAWLWRMMHGTYGSLFVSRFATGEIEDKGPDRGKDKGVLAARQVWEASMRNFSPDTVKTAFRQAVQVHSEFPPTLPQFVALCHANKPRQTYRPAAGAAIEMGQPLRSAYAAKAREINACYDAKGYSRATQTQPDDSVGGLDLLKQAIAQAVACTGGDEAIELMRLDRLLAPTCKTRMIIKNEG